MAFYRALWLSVTGVVVFASVAVALVSLPCQGLLGLALLGAFVGPLLGVAIHPRTDENTALPIYLLPATIAAVVGTIAAAGLIAVSAAIALPVTTLLAACSPPVLRRLARAPWTGKPRPDTVVATPTPPPAPRRRRRGRYRPATPSATPSCAGGGAPVLPLCSAPSRPPSSCTSSSSGLRCATSSPSETQRDSPSGSTAGPAPPATRPATLPASLPAATSPSNATTHDSPRESTRASTTRKITTRP